MGHPDPDSDVAELRAEMSRMEERLATLEEAVQFLAYCKRVEPNFAFYDWLVKNRVYSEQRTRLEHPWRAPDVGRVYPPSVIF